MLPSSDHTQPALPETTGLAGIRSEIDRLDDAIHDLLMARAALVEKLAASGVKRGTPFRPAREARILRRLLARHHGPLPRATLVGIWRELLGGMTCIQAPFSVVVWSPTPGSGHLALAREQFGAAVPILGVRSPAEVMRAVASGEGSVGVLPLPEDGVNAEDGIEPWWVSLMRCHGAGLAVVSRLPFVTLRPDGAPDVSALVVAALTPEASGEDRSLVAFEASAAVSRAAVAELVAAAGFALCRLVTHRADPNLILCLAEVDGLVEAGDPRLTALANFGLVRAVVLGAWPVPPPPSAFAPQE
ncbi:MAG: chorismate mutase [Elioraea sp.]|nr:chorismate mutase [Elioraea sp.]